MTEKRIMKPHTKLYMKALGYDEGDVIPSELSGQPAQDLHHINARGMGGTSSAEKECIFNYMALTREEHEKYGDRKQYKEWLKVKHLEFMMKRAVRIMGVYNQVNFYKGKIEFLES